MSDNYRRDLRIDRYNLEEELVRQPQLYMEWALKASEASIEREDAKNRLELAKAEIDKRIRTYPEKFDFDGKPTEPAIKLTVERHPKVKRYQKKYLEALRDEKILNEAKNAFQHRKKMLESLVSLNVQLHFAEPKVPLTRQEQIYDRRSRDIKRQLKRRKDRY